jgi:uncharacterized protein
MTAPDLEWKGSIAGIDREQWNALAHAQQSPFLEWEWLELLERSGSVGQGTGWRPLHLTVRDAGRLVAAAPLYLKADSRGEFVFDQLWANTAAMLGIPYYPKLLGMSPFTPTGTYLPLFAPGVDQSDMTGIMAAEIERISRGSGLCGIGFNFIDPAWGEVLSDLGYALWKHQGFRWANMGLRSFDEYLSLLNANARRNIRRERRSLRDAGIAVRMLAGAELTPELLDRMHELYVGHNESFGPWGCRFLTREFFASIPDRLAHRVMLGVAHPESDPDRVLAMALFVRKGDRLYGRYWGAAAQVEFLHFELCYYAPIEWCIEHSVALFDPGMGGVHKTRRGFEAVTTMSAHKLMDPIMRRVMDTHIGALNEQETAEIDALNSELPFANPGAPARCADNRSRRTLSDSRK